EEAVEAHDEPEVERQRHHDEEADESLEGEGPERSQRGHVRAHQGDDVGGIDGPIGSVRPHGHEACRTGNACCNRCCVATILAFVSAVAGGPFPSRRAFPPFDHAWVGWIALVPLLLLVHGRSTRTAFLWGACYGIASGYAVAVG